MKIYQLHSQTDDTILSFVLCHPDGTLTVIDGGWRKDAKRLLSFLRRLAGPVPHIHRWILTHGHADHIGALMELCEHHAGEWTVDDLYWDFPDIDLVYRLEAFNAGGLEEFALLRENLPGRQHAPKVGDEIAPGLKVLQAHDPEDESLKVKCDVVNNTCMVLRLDTDGCRIMLLGDLGAAAGYKLLKRWGGTGELKADMVQMAHHGSDGAEKEVYAEIAPKICYWPTPRWLWDNNLDGQGAGTGPWRTMETRRWMEEIGAKTHVKDWEGSHVFETHQGTISVRKIEA